MPQFAPNHVANILKLVRGKYYDDLAIVRAQDNYVVQWGDPQGKKPVGTAHRTLVAEFERPLRGLAITKLPDPDTYASEVGFVEGFPVAEDPSVGRAWLVHCYGMVGAGRDDRRGERRERRRGRRRGGGEGSAGRRCRGDQADRVPHESRCQGSGVLDP